MKMKRIIYTLACLLLTIGAWAQNVAKIGTTEYASLADAIAAVQTGETITLLEDITLTSTATVGTSTDKHARQFTIDFNGKTVTKSSSTIFTIYDDVTLTGNGQIDYYGYGITAYAVKAYGNVTIDGVNITDKKNNAGCIVGAFSGATLTLKDGTITSDKPRSIVNVANGGTFVMDGGKLVSNYNVANSSAACINVAAGGTATVNGGEIEAALVAVWVDGEANIDGGKLTAPHIVWVNKGETNITGGEFYANPTAVYLYTATSVANISGGEFFATGSDKKFLINKYDAVRDESSVTITGGIFHDFNPYDNKAEGEGTNFLPDNLVGKDNGDGTVTIVPAAVKVGNKGYETLAEALAAVPTDGTETTVTMLSDVDITSALTIANTQNVVLDLNGKTIKNDASKTLAQLITVNGQLTVDDSSAEKNGVIKNTASGKYVIKTGTAASVLTLNNGTVQTTTGNSNGAVYAISGSFVMTGGKIIAAGTGVTSKNVTISGGEITATAGQALCAAGTITGGSFTSANNYAVYANQSGTLEITGGTFAGVSSKPTINIYTTDVKVTGVTLPNGIGFASNATAMILSGTDSEYLDAAHAEYYDGETLVGYAPINTGLLANAKVSDKTVKLIKDVATTTYMNVTKSFTLDLNGYNITCTPTKADAVFATKGTVSAPVELTIKGEGKVSCADHGEGCNAIQVGNYTTVNIEGGEYSVTGDNSTIYMLATTGNSVVNISGGTFESGDGKYVLNIKDDCRDHNSFVVTGGTYVGFNPEDNIAEGEGTNFVADGYKAIDNGDGTYTVVERNYIAQIGDVLYESLDEAIEEAQEGETVTLLDDAETTKESIPANVTIDANGNELTMPIFVVIDGEPIDYPTITGTETYKVRKAIYKRTNISATEWGTVCLPFTLTSGNGADYYTYNNISGSTLTVDETTESIEAHTPVVFKKTTADLEICEPDATVSLVEPEEMTNGALVGTYESVDIPADGSIYYINGDKFHKTQVSLKVPAYRAYINYTDGGEAAPRTLSILVGGEDDATAIGSLASEGSGVDAIYDASGRKIAATQKGINIVKLTNGKTVKVFVK